MEVFHHQQWNRNPSDHGLSGHGCPGRRWWRHMATLDGSGWSFLGIWHFTSHFLTGAKRREWMGCWGLLGVAGMMKLLVMTGIIPENSLLNTSKFQATGSNGGRTGLFGMLGADLKEISPSIPTWNFDLHETSLLTKGWLVLGRDWTGRGFFLDQQSHLWK